MEALSGVFIFCIGFLVGFIFAAVLSSAED